MISMGCLPRSACLGSLSLTQSPNSLVFEEGLEIRDNHLWYVISKVVFHVGNKMLQDIPTASYGDPTASALCHC
uniref:Uncharacterized protein n=1 Tax=Tanacetum cinerariifolium TaxID=118510 RepID=A0A699UF16_TANCI|nr:hypothetical protein [Tanacetum cinerariifolium]